MNREEAKELLLDLVNAKTPSGVPLLPVEAREAVQILVEEQELPSELEEAADKYAHSLGYDEVKERLEIVSAKEDFIAGAEYQRKQDQSLIELAEDHAMLAGRIQMKEEMMEKAVEGIVQDNGQFINFGDGRYIDLDPTMENKPVFELTDGDKVKVIVIKEEK